MQTARFRWFILISLMIHTVFLCLFGFIPPLQIKAVLSSWGRVAFYSVYHQNRRPLVRRKDHVGRQGRTASLPGPTRTTPLAPSVKTEIPSSTERTFLTRNRNISRPWRNVFRCGNHCAGIRRNSHWQWRIAFRHRGYILRRRRRSHRNERRLSWVGRYFDREKGGSSASERDDFSGVEIPSYVIDAAGFRSRFDDGGIYPEIDSYVLYGDRQADRNPRTGHRSLYRRRPATHQGAYDDY